MKDICAVYTIVRKYKEDKISRYTYQLESWNICDEEMSSGIFFEFRTGLGSYV